MTFDLGGNLYSKYYFHHLECCKLWSLNYLVHYSSLSKVFLIINISIVMATLKDGHIKRSIL